MSRPRGAQKPFLAGTANAAEVCAAVEAARQGGASDVVVLPAHVLTQLNPEMPTRARSRLCCSSSMWAVGLRPRWESGIDCRGRFGAPGRKPRFPVRRRCRFCVLVEPTDWPNSSPPARKQCVCGTGLTQDECPYRGRVTGYDARCTSLQTWCGELITEETVRSVRPNGGLGTSRDSTSSRARGSERTPRSEPHVVVPG